MILKIVRISAMWCPACIIMNKFWSNVEKKFSNIEFVTYDLDMDEDVVKEYTPGDILPVLIAFEDGKELKRTVGEKNLEDTMKFIEEVVEYGKENI